MHDFAPAFAVLVVMLIPIISILTRHRQKMTLLMRQRDPNKGLLPNSLNPEMYSLQGEVHELKGLVASLALSVDNSKDEVRTSRQLQDRVKIGE